MSTGSVYKNTNFPIFGIGIYKYPSNMFKQGDSNYKRTTANSFEAVSIVISYWLFRGDPENCLHTTFFSY